jgi:hypothetical protein
MRPSVLFLTASLLALGFGVGFLVAPASVIAWYGASTDASTVLLSRFFGVALVQLGLSVYLLREVRETTTVRALAVGGTVGSAFGALVALGGVLDGVTNALGWSTVAIYVFLLLGYASCLRARPVSV